MQEARGLSQQDGQVLINEKIVYLDSMCHMDSFPGTESKHDMVSVINAPRFIQHRPDSPSSVAQHPKHSQRSFHETSDYGQ